MGKITEYALLASPAPDDLLVVVDVSDTSMASSGTDKKAPVGSLPFLPCRLDAAASWTSANPVLPASVLGVETDTGLAKLGNGTATWTALPYWNPGGGGGGGGTTRRGSVSRSLAMTLAIHPVVSQPQDHVVGVSPVLGISPSIAGQAAGTSPTPSLVTEISGSTVTSNQFQVTTLDVSPTAVGNLFILAFNGGASALADTAVSGGGVTSWARATGVEYDSSGTPILLVEIWTGVITAAGPAVITVSNPGMTAWPKFFCREYTSSGQDLQWSVTTASPSSPVQQGSPSHAGSPIPLPSTLPAGSYLGAAAAAWGGLTGVAVTGVSYNTAASGLGIAQDLNGPSDVAPSFTDNNSGDQSNVAAIIFEALTQYVSLEVLIPEVIPDGTATESYGITFTGAGGTGIGYQFAVNSGSLPAGLAMDPDGAVSGTTTTPGTSTFSVILKDSSGASTVSKDLSVTVKALPPIVFTRSYPADPNAGDDYRPGVNIPEIYIKGAGANSSANVSMNLWGPVSGEQATLNVYSVTEWDFLCRVTNPGGSVTGFPNSSSWLINIPDWYNFDFFISGWDEVMDGTPANTQGIIASACYDNWFTNTLVGPTGSAVNEIMTHFDFRSRGGGPYAATVVPFGGYSVNGVFIPRTYWDIAYGPTTLYFNQVDASGNYLSTPTGAVDFKAQFQWCVDHGYLDPAAPMWAFSLGFEVCHTAGVQRKFRYNNMWWSGGMNP